RNAAAFLFDPKSGDLILTDNGIDGFQDPTEPLSADEVERISASDVGVNPPDYGFPDSYVEYRTNKTIGGSGTPPFAVFRPLDGSEAEGVSAVALVPEAFGGWLAGKLVAGFHGQFDEVGANNEENPVRVVDLKTGESIELIANDNPTLGHIDAMASIGDTL